MAGLAAGQYVMKVVGWLHRSRIVGKKQLGLQVHWRKGNTAIAIAFQKMFFLHLQNL